MQRDERDDVDERLGELGRREVEHDDGDEAARQHQDAGEEAAMRLLQDLRSVLAALLRYTTHNTHLVNLTNSRPGKPGLSTYPYIHTYIQPLNGPLSGTTQVSRYQIGKTNLDFTGAKDSE